MMLRRRVSPDLSLNNNLHVADAHFDVVPPRNRNAWFGTSEASFSVWTRRSCVVRNSSSDFASSWVRCCSASNSRTFSNAITAWSANNSTSSICF